MRPITKQRTARRRTYLDPHFFAGWMRKQGRSPRNSYETPTSWVRYQITIDEVLEDLVYGQD